MATILSVHSTQKSQFDELRKSIGLTAVDIASLISENFTLSLLSFEPEYLILSVIQRIVQLTQLHNYWCENVNWTSYVRDRNIIVFGLSEPTAAIGVGRASDDALALTNTVKYSLSLALNSDVKMIRLTAAKQSQPLIKSSSDPRMTSMIYSRNSVLPYAMEFKPLPVFGFLEK